MNDGELTAKAIKQLELHTGLVSKVIWSDSKGRKKTLIQFDNNQVKLIAEVKKWNVHSDRDATLEQIKTSGDCNNKILISDYIDDDLGVRLQGAKLNYLDNAGNAFLNIAPIFVLIQGKTPQQSPDQAKAAKLFNDTGLKVIFALLSNPGLLNANYREIANHSNVSMGTIGWVLRELKDQQFTAETYRSREWLDKARLIKKWSEEYPKLRTKNQLGCFYSHDKDWWKTIDLDRYDARLGGEIAAISYTNNRVPRTGVIYVGKHKHRDLIRELRLIKVDDARRELSGNIEILNKFWGKAEELSLLNNSTHPLITYADLMSTWDPTSQKLARQIADNYLRC